MSNEPLKPCPCCPECDPEKDLTNPRDDARGIDYVVCQICNLTADRMGWNRIPRLSPATNSEAQAFKEEIAQLSAQLSESNNANDKLEGQLSCSTTEGFNSAFSSSLIDFVIKDESRPLSKVGLLIAMAEFIFSEDNCQVEFGSIDLGFTSWLFDDIAVFDFSLLPVIGDNFSDWEYGGEEWNEEHIKDWPEEYKNLARAKASGNTILFDSLSKQLEKSKANHE